LFDEILDAPAVTKDGTVKKRQEGKNTELKLREKGNN